jgi:hypothetical protein
MRQTAIRRNASEGSALILALVYLFAITLFATSFITLLHQTMSHMTREERTQVCINIAEGGLDKAIVELQARGDEYQGERGTSLGEGRFTIEVIKESDGAYRVVSEAQLDGRAAKGAHVRLEARARLAADGGVKELRWLEVKSE